MKRSLAEVNSTQNLEDDAYVFSFEKNTRNMEKREKIKKRGNTIFIDLVDADDESAKSHLLKNRTIFIDLVEESSSEINEDPVKVMIEKICDLEDKSVLFDTFEKKKDEEEEDLEKFILETFCALENISDCFDTFEKEEEEDPLKIVFENLCDLDDTSDLFDTFAIPQEEETELLDLVFHIEDSSDFLDTVEKKEEEDKSFHLNCSYGNLPSIGADEFEDIFSFSANWRAKQENNIYHIKEGEGEEKQLLHDWHKTFCLLKL